MHLKKEKQVPLCLNLGLVELYNIYCGFWEGMKKISVGGVPKWIYIVGNLKKRKVDCSRKDQVKKKWSWKKIVRKRINRKEVEVQFELYCVKLVELCDI